MLSESLLFSYASFRGLILVANVGFDLNKKASSAVVFSCPIFLQCGGGDVPFESLLKDVCSVP